MSDSKSVTKDDAYTTSVEPRRASVAKLTRDDARLEDLGYKPELKRNFSKLETFGGE